MYISHGRIASILNYRAFCILMAITSNYHCFAFYSYREMSRRRSKNFHDIVLCHISECLDTDTFALPRKVVTYFNCNIFSICSLGSYLAGRWTPFWNLPNCSWRSLVGLGKHLARQNWVGEATKLLCDPTSPWDSIGGAVEGSIARLLLRESGNP